MTTTVFVLLLLAACNAEALAGQSAAGGQPRIDVAVGVTSMTLRKLPDDAEVGGQPAGVLARVGYFWTRSLATRFETATQAESWNPDYALEYVERPVPGRGFESRMIQLKHNYASHRWTVAQFFQFRRLRFIQPYVGAGAGVESQTVTHSRHEAVPYITDTSRPNAKTVDELPTELPGPLETRYTIGFAEAGLKVFAGRRAYFAADWKTQPGERVRVGVVFGVELF